MDNAATAHHAQATSPCIPALPGVTSRLLATAQEAARTADHRRWMVDLPVPRSNVPTTCLIDTAVDGRGNPVVLVVESHRNQGMSVTNSAEHLHAAVAAHPSVIIRRDRPYRVWECYDQSSGYAWKDAHVHEVHVDAAGMPSWSNILDIRQCNDVSLIDAVALASFGFLRQAAVRQALFGESITPRDGQEI